MNIEIRAVSKINLNEVLSLSVKDSQQNFVETVSDCLDDAKEWEYYQPVGLYYKDTLVGFAMYGWFPDFDEDDVEIEEGTVWLDRFLIDQRFQGQGLGSKMLSFLIKHLAKLYKCDEIYLSIFDENTHALRLYRKFGFSFNSEYDFNGEKVMVKSFKFNRNIQF